MLSRETMLKIYKEIVEAKKWMAKRDYDNAKKSYDKIKKLYESLDKNRKRDIRSRVKALKKEIEHRINSKK